MSNYFYDFANPAKMISSILEQFVSMQSMDAVISHL